MRRSFIYLLFMEIILIIIYLPPNNIFLSLTFHLPTLYIYFLDKFLIIVIPAIMMRRVTILYNFRANCGQNPNDFKGVNLNKDYYRILEVQNTACDNSIKKSYFKMAKRLHPDFNPNGHDRFTEIQQAYNILSDKKLKGYYDMNNKFYPQPERTQQKRAYEEDGRNQQFYDDLKGKYYEDRQEYKEKRYTEEPQETEEQAKQRKKFQEEIELTRRILFTKNPIWERANAYMNYEERQRRAQEKEKQFETLFPKGAKIANYWKKWMF